MKQRSKAVPSSPAYDQALALFRSGRFDEALAAAHGLTLAEPRRGDAWNIKGVVLNNLGRPREALDALAQAAKLMPRSDAPLVNAAKSHLALGSAAEAAEAARKALRLNAKNIDAALFLARAKAQLGDLAGALASLQPALITHPANAQMRALRAGILRILGRTEEALRDIDRALEVAPSVSLRLDRAGLLVRLDRTAQGLAEIEAVLAASPEQPDALRFMAEWHYGREDRETANGFYRRSLASRFDVAVAGSLAFSLLNTRGPREADNIAEAQTLAARCSDEGLITVPNAKSFASVFDRTADFDRLDRIDFRACSEYWADNNVPAGLHNMLAHVKTLEDRRHLLRQHRRWGERAVARAALAAPAFIQTPRTRARIRVGIMSSDLRHHPVTYFALPIFESFDRDRFEIFAYSFYPKEPDGVQRHLAAKATDFKVITSGSDREVAETILRDDLDILFELGGSTHLNRLSVLAHKVAPVQASWLGYPHSAGLPTIDYILVDPFIKPAADLIVEKPFEMAKSWVTMSRLGFDDRVAVDKVQPLERNGYITFGTANTPSKYSRDLIALWAAAMRAVPQSRFLFIRPEGAVPAFRENIAKAFAAGGIDPDRIAFRAVRGTHLQHYNEIDIALDTAPQTGGTTTCETLWMGVPVITLVGPAFFERLSYSNLTNAGLGDLCAHDRDSFVAIAARLAGDHARLIRIRRNLRGHLRRATPLGDTAAWVENWQQTVSRVVAGPPGR
jgi:protein O-GlcNAc transferase